MHKCMTVFVVRRSIRRVLITVPRFREEIKSLPCLNNKNPAAFQHIEYTPSSKLRKKIEKIWTLVNYNYSSFDQNSFQYIISWKRETRKFLFKKRKKNQNYDSFFHIFLYFLGFNSVIILFNTIFWNKVFNNRFLHTESSIDRSINRMLSIHRETMVVYARATLQWRFRNAKSSGRNDDRRKGREKIGAR